ncbi:MULTISPECIES: hypothetical protein [Vibrio]|uniref:hypothetical protein n=1 Tax=Vibrio TaxID=662 RepID=UPI003D6A7586
MRRWHLLVRRLLEEEGITQFVFGSAGSGHIAICSPYLRGRLIVSSTPKKEKRTLQNIRRDVRRLKIPQEVCDD